MRRRTVPQRRRGEDIDVVPELTGPDVLSFLASLVDGESVPDERLIERKLATNLETIWLYIEHCGFEELFRLLATSSIQMLEHIRNFNISLSELKLLIDVYGCSKALEYVVFVALPVFYLKPNKLCELAERVLKSG